MYCGGHFFKVIKVLKNKVIAYSREIGVSSIGFTTADRFDELAPVLKEHEQNGWLSGFEERDIEKRIDPKLTLPTAKSIISIAVSYPFFADFPLNDRENGPRGLFSRSSWGTDYHHVVAEKLKHIAEFIKSHDQNAECITMVDTGVLSDRAVARRAGIGWSGKNGAIISPTFGSFIFLGEIITNVHFEPDPQLENQCGTCTKCIDACPGNAIVGDGKIDAKKCLSFQTQSKGAIAEEYRDKLGNRLFGCDTCQIVCKCNQNREKEFYSAFEPEHGIVNPSLREIIQMTNRQFKEKHGHLAGAWRGRTPIQRNAIYGLAFYKDKESLPILEKLAKNDPREEIREASKWAIEKINS